MCLQGSIWKYILGFPCLNIWLSVQDLDILLMSAFGNAPLASSPRSSFDPLPCWRGLMQTSYQSGFRCEFFLQLPHFQFFQPLNGRTLETTRRGKLIVRFFGWPLCQSAVSEVNWALWSDSISSKYITTPLIFFDSASLPWSEGLQILMNTNRLEMLSCEGFFAQG